MDRVELRGQQSKADPWYFVVRHADVPSVVAYVHPRQHEVHIEYRLPSSHESYGVAVGRDGPYGLVVKIRQSADMATAIQLLRDALPLGS